MWRTGARFARELLGGLQRHAYLAASILRWRQADLAASAAVRLREVVCSAAVRQSVVVWVPARARASAETCSREHARCGGAARDSAA